MISFSHISHTTPVLESITSRLSELLNKHIIMQRDPYPSYLITGYFFQYLFKMVFSSAFTAAKPHFVHTIPLKKKSRINPPEFYGLRIIFSLCEDPQGKNTAGFAYCSEMPSLKDKVEEISNECAELDSIKDYIVPRTSAMLYFYFGIILI